MSLPPSNDAVPYTGVDILEVMAEAENYNQDLTDRVLAHARPGDAICDFGAGMGTFARRIVAAGHAVTCVEPDGLLRRELAKAGLPFLADIEEAADASLDYVYTLNVLEHIEDDGASLRAIRRKLKPDGRLLVYVPAFPLLFSAMDRKVCHFRRYRAATFRRTLAEAGFAADDCRYADTIGFFATLAYKLVGNREGRIDLGPLKFFDRHLFPLNRFLDPVFGRLLGKNLVAVARPARVG